MNNVKNTRPKHTEFVSSEPESILNDASTLARLVVRQRHRILILCRKWLHHPRDAEDACQETLLRITRAWETFRSDCKPESWIFLITLNVCRNFNRRARRRKFGCAVEYNDALSSDSEGSIVQHPRYGAPDELLERAQFLQLLDECVCELTESSQEILRLKINDGLTYEEVGTSLGLAAGTVKSRIFRARRHLRQRVAAFAR